MKFKLNHLIVELDHPVPSLEKFFCDSGDSDVVFTSVSAPFVPKEKHPAAVHPDFSVYHYETGWLYETPAGEQLYISADYTRGYLYIPEKMNPHFQNIRLLLLLRVAIECRLARDGIVSLHCACVEKDGMAVSFTGVSGTGKSTRAEIWKNHLQAEWISGDRPSISVTERKAIGVPWDGKEQIFQNVQVPLLAILDVRRGGFTSIRRLSAAQARRVLMQQCFLPMWDSETAMLVMANIYKLLQTQPVYRIICDRTEQGAEETYEILFHHQDKIQKEAVDMRIKEGFVLKNFMGEYMVMPTGDNIAKFDGSIALNEVSAFIFKKLETPVSKDELLAYILNEYDIDKKTAEEDLTRILDLFQEYGILAQEA